MSFLLKDKLASQQRAKAIAEASAKLKETAPISETDEHEDDNADVKAMIANTTPAEQENPIKRMKRLAAERNAPKQEEAKVLANTIINLDKEPKHVAEAQRAEPINTVGDAQAERVLVRPASSPALEGVGATGNKGQQEGQTLPEKKLTLKEKLALKKQQAKPSIAEADIKRVEEATSKDIEQAKPEALSEKNMRHALNAKEGTESFKAIIKSTIEEDIAAIDKATELAEPDRPLTLKEKIALKKAQEAHAAEVEAQASALINGQIGEFGKLVKDVQTPRIDITDSNNGIKGAPQVQALTEQVAPATVAANRQVVRLNEKQKEAVETFKERACVLIGKAGTGKTTSVREIVKWLLGQVPRTADFKKQNGGGQAARVTGQPRIGIVSFTKRAVTNIKNSCIQAMPELKDAEWCFQSIHNILEYAPEYYEDINENGDVVQKMRFAPMKGAHDLIHVDYLIVEEASMVNLDLWEKVLDALPSHCRILLLGDICQLPPVFGLSILIYAMAKLPVIELGEVYRTKLGPVLNGALNILEGKMPEWGEAETGSLQLYIPWKNEKGKIDICNAHKPKAGNEQQYGAEKLSAIYEKLFANMYRKGVYDPEQDMILSPFNKGPLGTTELNKAIAQFVGTDRNAEVFEILAGWEKHYLAIGDKIMLDKQDGVITNIMPNIKYIGNQPQPAGTDLSRWGHRIIGGGSKTGGADLDLDHYANFSLDAMLEEGEDEDSGARAASHVVEVELETGQRVTLGSKGDFNGDKFTLGYALTGHKAQGSEWRNVYIVMHKDHHTLINREWFYTCLTRTRENCTVLANTFTIKKAITTQRIPGNSLEEKLAWFLKDATDIEDVQVCPS